MTCLVTTVLFSLMAFSGPAPLQIYANGFIAHDSLYPGMVFDELEIGEIIVVDCGTPKEYEITEISEYQAITPDLFRHGKEVLSGRALFRRIYNHPDEIVLQTCIRRGGNWEWGRLFVRAEWVQ